MMEKVCLSCGRPKISPRAVLCRSCRDETRRVLVALDRDLEDRGLLQDVEERGQSAVALERGVSRQAISRLVQRARKRVEREEGKKGCGADCGITDAGEMYHCPVCHGRIARGRDTQPVTPGE